MYQVSKDRLTTSRKTGKDSDGKWFASPFQGSTQPSAWQYPVMKYQTLRLHAPVPRSFKVELSDGYFLFGSNGWDFHS